MNRIVASKTIRSTAVSLPYCKTPTLILYGEEDDRVPVSQAWEIYRALTDLGVEVQMILYPGAGHGISEPKQFVDVVARWVEWYKRFIN
jgi:dipeptidyl aminopeptidase/acylaminoacyl peptidase